MSKQSGTNSRLGLKYKYIIEMHTTVVKMTSKKPFHTGYAVYNLQRRLQFRRNILDYHWSFLIIWLQLPSSLKGSVLNPCMHDEYLDLVEVLSDLQCLINNFQHAILVSVIPTKFKHVFTCACKSLGTLLKSQDMYWYQKYVSRPICLLSYRWIFWFHLST